MRGGGALGNSSIARDCDFPVNMAAHRNGSPDPMPGRARRPYRVYRHGAEPLNAPCCYSNVGFIHFLLCLAVIVLVFCPPASARADSMLDRLDISVHGFADVRGGVRTADDPNQKDTSLAELRVQGDIQRVGDLATWLLRFDIVHDGVLDDVETDLETGAGIVDLREANVLFSPLSWMDMKIGRQILTWGTGDLLFINDVFPKDWPAFFIGRDVPYLKAPSDAVLLSVFPTWANIDVAYTPRFDPDRYISGERISFWNSMAGMRTGRRNVVEVDKPDEWFDDDETAVRISRNLSGYEVALYGYQGFWKSPKGFDPATTNATFPELIAAGVSLRGPMGKGLFNIEAGFYSSEEDTRGDDPFVPNSEARLLAGYERELARELTAKLQYYVEFMQDHDAYEGSLPPGMSAAKEYRDVVTLRLTRQAFSQNVTASLFLYWSPADKDGYARPNVSYKITDLWLASIGANLFAGEEDQTFFNQFEKNNNIYAALRYSF